MHAKKRPTYLSITEAATVMSVSTKTIRRRISDGTIPAYHCGRTHIVIPPRRARSGL
jgi:excisionase family DNA binding protein